MEYGDALVAMTCACAAYAFGRFGTKKFGKIALAVLLIAPLVWLCAPLFPELFSGDGEARGWSLIVIVVTFMSYSGYAVLCLIGFAFGRTANAGLT